MYFYKILMVKVVIIALKYVILLNTIIRIKTVVVFLLVQKRKKA